MASAHQHSPHRRLYPSSGSSSAPLRGTARALLVSWSHRVQPATWDGYHAVPLLRWTRTKVAASETEGPLPTSERTLERSGFRREVASFAMLPWWMQFS